MSERVATRYDGNCARSGRMRAATACTTFIPAARWMAARAFDLCKRAGRVSAVASSNSCAEIPQVRISFKATSMASPPAFHLASMSAGPRSMACSSLLGGRPVD
eukprot:12945266-Heterocapsa_arctica.AAC.1